MKKFCFFIVLIFIAFTFSGCNFSKKFNTSISEIYHNLYYANSDNMEVTLGIGERENPYVVDGESNDLIPFAVLTFYNNATAFKNDNVNYKLLVGTIDYSGTFEVNPFDRSYVVDLEIIANSEQISLIITADKKSYNFILENVLDKTDAQSDDIKKLALDNFKTFKKDLIKKGHFSAEIYIRLMKKGNAKALWYVSVYKTDGTFFAVVVDPTTRDILARHNPAPSTPKNT